MADTTHNIRIRMDTSGVRQGQQETRQALQNVEQGADRASQRVTLLGRAFNNLRTQILSMNSAVAGFSAGFAALASVQVLAGFDDQMANVRAVTLATDEDFKRLRDTALDLGATTRYTATQAAEGLELLARAGADTNGAISLIIPTLNLAQAENLNLAESADYLAKITQGMRLELSEGAKVADVLAATASATATDVRQLGAAMRYAAAISSGFKTPIEEVAAALGVLANSGLAGEQAGTAVRGILSRIAAPSKDFVGALKEVGLTIKDIDPAANSLVTILQKLADANITTSEAFDLFKQRAGSGAEILVNNVAKVKELQKTLEGARGNLQKKFEIKADTLISDLRSVLSGVQAIIIALGDAGLTTVLRSVSQVLASTFRGIAATITQIAPLIYNIGLALAIVFSPVALLAFAGGMIRLIPLFAALTVQIGRAAVAMVVLAAANPFTALAVAIGATITFVQQFGDRFRAIGTDMANLQDLLQAITEKIGEGFDRIATAASSAFQSVVNYATTAANFLSSSFSGAIDFVVSKLNALLEFENSVSNSVRRLVGSQEIQSGKLGVPDFSIKAPSIVGDVLSRADDIAAVRREEELGAALRETHTRLVANSAAKKENAAASRGLAGEEENLRSAHSRTRDVLDGIFGQQQDALANIATLNRLFSEGKVSVSEYADQLQRMRGQLLQNDQTLKGGLLKGLNQVAEGATRLGDAVAQSVSNAFSTASDAIADFAVTGKFSISDFANSILRDMTKLASNAIFGSLINGLLGGIGGPALGGAGALGGGGLGSLFGFAGGGSFRVGGSGGTDSKLVAFKATPGEMVDVRTPGQSMGRGGGTTVNVFNEGGGQARTETRRDSRGNEVIDVYIERAVNEKIAGGRFDPVMRGRYATQPTLIKR
jgi:TP901 family phage tail tape measure protein/lambda family phage tail tape measure protein